MRFDETELVDHHADNGAVNAPVSNQSGERTGGPTRSPSCECGIRLSRLIVISCRACKVRIVDDWKAPFRLLVRVM
jgi:hypothetical protein